MTVMRFNVFPMLPKSMRGIVVKLRKKVQKSELDMMMNDTRLNVRSHRSHVKIRESVHRERQGQRRDTIFTVAFEGVYSGRGELKVFTRTR